MAVNQTKKEAILEIASAAFLQHGYQGASVNEMSRRSGISKETIYRYFNNKKELFAAVLDRELDTYQRGIQELGEIDQGMDVRDVLMRVGSMLLKLLLQKRTMALRLLVFNASQRQPEIGQLYNERGPRRAMTALEHYFTELARQGKSGRIPPRDTTEDFMALILHRVVLQYELNLEDKLAHEDIEAYVSSIVDRFLITHF